MRVSTAYINEINLKRMQASNERLATLTYQSATGLKAEHFSDIALDASELLNLQDLQINTNQYIENIDNAVARMRTMENSLQGMSDLLVEAANLATLGRNETSAEVRATLAPKAEGLANSLFNLMQTKFDDRFIFSGVRGEASPITTAPTANPFPGDPPPTTYYTGDPVRMQTITSPGNAESYGITADQLGFARMKAGLESLWFGLENNSLPDIDGAIDLLTAAQQDVSNMLGTIGGDISGFNLLKTRHENSNQFVTDRIDELEKVDIAETITKFTQEQASLESSMLVITRLASLTLLDFLR